MYTHVRTAGYAPDISLFVLEQNGAYDSVTDGVKYEMYNHL